MAGDLPDPSEKSVIILTGEFSGQEGFCLGPTDTDGVYAVTPTGSNHILELRLDEDFGILLNPGQSSARN